MTESEPRNLFSKPPILSHFSDFESLKNLSKFHFCFALQIRMRNCKPYTEVSKETLNPHYIYSRVPHHLMTKNIKDHYSIGFNKNNNLFYLLKIPLFAIIFCFWNNISVFWIFIFAVSFSPFKFKLV